MGNIRTLGEPQGCCEWSGGGVGGASGGGGVFSHMTKVTKNGYDSPNKGRCLFLENAHGTILSLCSGMISFLAVSEMLSSTWSNYSLLKTLIFTFLEYRCV